VSQELCRHQPQFKLLGPVHGSFGRLYRMTAASLYFDEAKSSPVPADHVDFTLSPRGAPIARDDNVALAAKKVVSQILALDASLQMCRTAALAP